MTPEQEMALCVVIIINAFGALLAIWASLRHQNKIMDSCRPVIPFNPGVYYADLGERES
jgi:hypothetical protein